MEINKDNNEIFYKPFLNFKNKQKKVEKPKIKIVKNIFLTKTFASKLFIKLCREVIDPIIICLQTLKYESENRKKEEIESTIPYLKTLEYFNDFVHFLETQKSGFDLMTKFARITFYQYHRKNSIIKRPGDYNDKFFIVLNGEIDKYNLIFDVENLSLEQYLLYLIKLEIINENEIINKCYTLNKDIIDINLDKGETFTVEKLVNRSNKYNYYEMLLKAEKELVKLDFNSDLYKRGKLRIAPSVENYLRIFDNFEKYNDKQGKNKFQFYIGKYKLCMKLNKGQFFNDISELDIKETNLYLCKTNCDLGQIKKDDYIKSKLNIEIKNKMKRLFSQVKNSFFILRNIDDEKFLNNYSNLFLYKKYKKGDKIFYQEGYFTGMYLVLEGNISLYCTSGIDKLSNLLFSIVSSVKSFSEYIPSFNAEEIINNFNLLHDSIYKSTNLTLAECLEKRKIDISIQKKFDILGFYELVNNKTDLYNFTAECISQEATLLFIPRNGLNIIIGRETLFHKSLASIVENKIQFIIGKFKTFVQKIINNYKIKTIKEISPKQIKFSRNKIKIFSSSNNIKNRNKIFMKLNDNEKKSDIVYNYTNFKNYNYFESLNNFKNELNKKKKLAEELLIINKNKSNILHQNNLIKFYTPKTIENKFFNGVFLTTNLNNNINNIDNRINTHKSVDITLNKKNPYSTYYSLNKSISGFKQNEKNPFYISNTKDYQAFPLINQGRNYIY